MPSQSTRDGSFSFRNCVSAFPVAADGAAPQEAEQALGLT